MLEIKELDCYYSGMRVLQSINLSADKGEIIGIIGPNGSGKTTLLRIISKVIKPKIGSVLIRGKDVQEMKASELARELAVVAQDTGINFDFSVLEVVLMGRTPHLKRFQAEGEKDLAIAKKAMEATDTLHLADRSITEISGGERQRVIIARALAQEPKLLLLDEPTSNLDINYRLEILDLIKKLTKKGLTVIMAIHDLNLAAQYCDRMVMLNNGRIISAGLPEEVLTPENIKHAFKVEAVVRRHELTNSLYVTILPNREINPSRDVKIHLICGAGSGAELMNALFNKGYQVTAGVLNVIDTDHEVAQSLGMSVISEAPFSPVSEDSHKANLELIKEADVVVLTNPPFGRGNLRNLEAAQAAMDFGVPLLYVAQKQVLGHDFIYPKVQRLLKKIKKGAAVVSDSSKALEFIELRWRNGYR